MCTDRRSLVDGVAVGVGVPVDVGVVAVAALLDDGVESVVFVRGVLYMTDCAVSLVERVPSMDLVAVPVFPLALHVVCVRVVDRVVELVVGLRLHRQKYVVVEEGQVPVLG